MIATDEWVRFEVSYKELERALRAVVADAERSVALAWLSELSRHLDHVIDAAELESVATWSTHLDRLVANLPNSELTELVAGYLTGMLHRLDRSAAALSQRRDVEERDRIAGGVREQVLALLVDRPRRRSGEIAGALGIAPSQASRALRELQQRGLVFRVDLDPADHDKRVHRYIAARSA